LDALAAARLVSLTSTRSAIDNRETFARTIGVSGGEEKDQDEF